MAAVGGLRPVADLSNLKVNLDKYNHKLAAGNSLRRHFNRDVTVSNTAIGVPLLDPVDSNNVQRFSLVVWVTVYEYDTGYAWHPINQWNAGGTNSASIVLYAFQDFRAGGGGTVGDGLGNNDHGRYGFYYHRYNNGGWSGITVEESDSKLGGLAERSNFPRRNMFAFCYDVNENSSTPIMYVNGQYHNQGGASPNGIGNYTYANTDLFVWTDKYSNTETPTGVTFLQVYDEYLTADDIAKLYNHTKKKHGYG
jgi:hypothetical protein